MPPGVGIYGGRAGSSRPAHRASHPGRWPPETRGCGGSEAGHTRASPTSGQLCRLLACPQHLCPAPDRSAPRRYPRHTRLGTWNHGAGPPPVPHPVGLLSSSWLKSSLRFVGVSRPRTPSPAPSTAPSSTSSDYGAASPPPRSPPCSWPTHCPACRGPKRELTQVSALGQDGLRSPAWHRAGSWGRFMNERNNPATEMGGGKVEKDLPAFRAAAEASGVAPSP